MRRKATFSLMLKIAGQERDLCLRIKDPNSLLQPSQNWTSSSLGPEA